MQVGHETTYAAIRNHHFSLKHVIVRPTKIIKDLCKACAYINAIYVLALQRSLIIVIGLAMTCYSGKNYDFLYMHKSFHVQLTQTILNGIYPRCSVCMMNMGSNSGYFAGQSHMMPSGGKTGKKVTPFGSFFSWCQTCRHGGHCDHMEGTFHIK